MLSPTTPSRLKSLITDYSKEPLADDGECRGDDGVQVRRDGWVGVGDDDDETGKITCIDLK